MRRSKKPDREKQPYDPSQILTGQEVSEAKKGLKKLFGASYGPVVKKSKVNVERMIRFMSVSSRLKRERESRGLTIKDAAVKLKVPQYRLTEIENGNVRHLKPDVLKRYISFLDLNEWLKGWVEVNPALAKELKLDDEENRDRRRR